MDSSTKLKGLRVVAKMILNVIDRLESGQDGWQVGCKCQDIHKAGFVKESLTQVLGVLQLPLDILLVNETTVEVRATLSPSTDNVVISQASEECDKIEDLPGLLPECCVGDSKTSTSHPELSSIPQTIDEINEAQERIRKSVEKLNFQAITSEKREKFL